MELQAPVRDILRTATRTRHEAVDRLFSHVAGSSREKYSVFLVAQARVLPGLERALRESGLCRDVPDIDARWRSAALVQDLDDLSVRVPDPVPVAAPRTRAEAAGALYVLEGSRLGGQYIRRQIASAHGDGVPVRFLSHGHGKALWPRFVAWLNGNSWDGNEIAAMTAAAKAVFAGYLVAPEQ